MSAALTRAADAGRDRLVLGVLSVGAALVYVVALAITGEPLLAVPLVAAAAAVATLASPFTGLVLLLVAALLFEQYAIAGLAPLTAQTHFFENLSTWSGLPLRLSLSDVLAGAVLASWGLRRLVGANERVRLAPLGWAVGAYGLAFALGMVIGAARGSTWWPIAALAEARGALYLCLLFFLTANVVRERRQVAVLLWVFALVTGVKALQAIGNYDEMKGAGLWLEAVTSHEDVIFFAAGIGLAPAMLLSGLRGRLLAVAAALGPLMLVADLLTQRRSAFAALTVVLAILVLLSLVRRPVLTGAALAVALVAGAGYTAMFWDSTSRLAEPVRLVKEVLAPHALSARDQSSNAWRDIENTNIAFTVRQLPLTGVGLGQEYLFVQEPPALGDSFTYWRLITHNALLWLFLKAGPYAAFAFWLVVAQAIAFGIALHRRLSDPLLRTAALLAVLLVAAQVVFSSVDEGLTYNRTMTVLGVALGLLVPLAGWARRPAPAG